MAIGYNTFEYNLFLSFTIIILILKLSIIIYISRVILKRRKEIGRFSFDFITGMLILIICFFVSRLLFVYFDFYLTKFDLSKYTQDSYILIWQIAMFILSIGFFFTLFTVDLKVLDFKFKGIFAYIMLGAGFFQLLFPIRTIDDFVFVNSVGLIYGLVAVILPIIFFYLGVKTKTLRLSAYSIAFGIIIYTIGGMVFNQSIIDPLMELYGEGILIIFYFFFLLFKTIGISVFAYGVVNFRL